MEIIKITKFREYKNGTCFGLKFDGIEHNVYDKEKINKLIDMFLDKDSLHSNMVNNIACIRTLLKALEEISLIVEYNDSDSYEVVKYANKSLYYFKFTNHNRENNNYIEIEYKSSRGLTFSLSNVEGKSLLDSQQMTITKEKFNKIMDYIESLSKVESVSLDNESKMIIEIYILFYGENPDFTEEDINIKFQTMMSILAQFNGYFDDVYNFNLTEKMPESQELLQIVNKLFPVSLEEIDFNESPIEFSSNKKEIIKIVGEAIRKSIDKETDMNEALITMSRIIFENRYNKEKEYDIKELAKNTGYPLNEIDTNVKLINAIQSNLTESKN